MSQSEETSDGSWRDLLTWPLPLGLLWLLIPVCGLLIRVALEPLTPHDYWWHLAMGRLIEEAGQIPAHNLFVYTLPADLSFHDQPWLGQWLMYVGWESFGHGGLVVVRNLIVAVTWVWLVGLGWRRCADPRFTGGVGLAVAAVTGAIFAVRTQMFAFLPYVGLLAVIFGVADRRLRPVWLLPLGLLGALWANLHGSFVLAPVLVGLAGAAEAAEAWWRAGRSLEAVDRRRLGLWAAGAAVSGLGALANPWGPEIYWYVVHLTFLSDLSATVTEWQPPNPGSPFGFLAIVAVLGSLAVLWRRREHVRWYEAALLGATAYLGLSAVRSLFWWGAVAVLVVPRHLAAWVDAPDWRAEQTSTVQGIGHVLVAVMLVAMALLSQPGLPGFALGAEALEGYGRRSGEGAAVLNYKNATELVNRVRREGWTGRIFHDQSIGGLLDFKLGARHPEKPRQVAFVDQRMEMIPPEVWKDYFDLSHAAPNWRELVEEHGIGTMILHPGDQWPLIQALQMSPEWRMRAVGEGHLWFERHSTASRTQPNRK